MGSGWVSDTAGDAQLVPFPSVPLSIPRFHCDRQAKKRTGNQELLLLCPQAMSSRAARIFQLKLCMSCVRLRGLKSRVKEKNIRPWALGDCCVSLKMLKSPHKEIYSLRLTMLWFSLSSSLSLPKYFHPYPHHDLWPRHRHVALILRMYM